MKKELFVVFLCLMFLLNCTPDVQSSGTVDETDTQIALTGKVNVRLKEMSVDVDVKGLIVKMAKTGFNDTTNENGFYNITVSKDTLLAMGINLDTLSDSLVVFKDGQIIGSMSIEKWIDTLPTISSIQRNLSGIFKPSISDPKRIEAVVTSFIYSPFNSVTESFNLYHFDVTSAFSGFIYSNDEMFDSFSVYINIFNTDSTLSGRSITIGYPNSAGNIDFLEIDPFNAVPSVNVSADNDTVGVNDTIRYSIVVSDSFGGFVSKIEIDIENTGIFLDIGTDTSFVMISPDSAKILTSIVKVTDNDGNSVFDTVSVTVLEPTLSINSKYSLISNDTILLSTSATSSQSLIVKWEWDVGNSGIFTETSPDSFVKVINPESSFVAVVRVTDEDGFSVMDTLLVSNYSVYNGMVLIPAKGSSFIMGQEGIHNGASSPVHQVSFTYDFYMDTTEVTQGEYDSIMSHAIFGYSGYSTPSWNSSYGIGPMYPVYYVNWYDAVLFCNAKSKAVGKDTVYSYSLISGTPGNNCTITTVNVDLSKDGFRLPTESEWEYSCRAGTTTEYFWGTDDVSNYAWYEVNSGNSTHEVASHAPNAFNLYDMPGNVWEWCTDGQDSYTSDAKIDPVGSLTASSRCGRGASLSDELGDLRSATRFSSPMTSTFPNFGFRTVIRIK